MAPKKKPGREFTDPDRLLREFAYRIARIRKWKGINQTVVAKATWVRQETLSRWEMGISWPPAESLIALAEFYGVSLEALIFGGRGRANVILPKDLLDVPETEEWHTWSKKKR